MSKFFSSLYVSGNSLVASAVLEPNVNESMSEQFHAWAPQEKLPTLQEPSISLGRSSHWVSQPDVMGTLLSLAVLPQTRELVVGLEPLLLSWGLQPRHASQFLITIPCGGTRAFHPSVPLMSVIMAAAFYF